MVEFEAKDISQQFINWQIWEKTKCWIWLMHTQERFF